MLPFVSIIVTIYNTEKYLKECLESILNQSFKDFQLILIDDGSTDKSSFICDEYKKRYDNIIEVIHKENEGQLASRLKGLKLAKGEYVYYVDSDDTIEVDFLNDIYEITKNDKPDILLINFKHIDEYGNIIKINKDDFQDGLVEKRLVFDYVVKEKINPLWRKIFKRELTDYETNFIEYLSARVGEDLIQSLPILSNAKTFYYLNTPYYNYRDNSTSISKKYNITRFNATVFKLKIVNKYLVELKYDTKEIKQKLFSHYFQMLWMDLFNYFFNCEKYKIEEDLNYLNTNFLKHKRWIKHIKISFLKKIGILLFLWKQWNMLRFYYYSVYYLYFLGIKKLLPKNKMI